MAALDLCCCTQAFSICSEWGLLSICNTWASHCAGFFCCRSQALGYMSFSSCGMRALEYRLSNSVQFSSVAQACLTLCNPMNCSMPGLPVHHQPLEFTQTHVHRVSDAIPPSHPLSSPYPPAPNPSQH